MLEIGFSSHERNQTYFEHMVISFYSLEKGIRLWKSELVFFFFWMLIISDLLISSQFRHQFRRTSDCMVPSENRILPLKSC